MRLWFRLLLTLFSPSRFATYLLARRVHEELMLELQANLNESRGAYQALRQVALDAIEARKAAERRVVLSHPPEFYEAKTNPCNEAPDPFPEETTVTEVDRCGCDESIMLREQLREDAELRRVCEAWRDEFKPLAPESVYQRDSVNEACPELVEHVLEVIGYYEAPADA